MFDIDRNAFLGCSALTNIDIPDSVSLIDEYAFKGCTALESVTLSGKISYIREGLFYECSALTGINFAGTTAQWDAICKRADWDYSTGNYTVYCIDGNIEK